MNVMFQLPLYLFTYILGGPVIAVDLYLGGPTKAFLRNWTNLYAYSEYGYEFKPSIAQATIVGSTVFFGSAMSVLFSTPLDSAKDWHIVVALAALLAATSLVQFQCGFARAIIFHRGRYFLQTPDTGSRSLI